MKITIVQDVIEEAIRNHILSQIAVKPGMVITMELRATRGDEGFIANINIAPGTSGSNETVVQKVADREVPEDVASDEPEAAPAITRTIARVAPTRMVRETPKLVEAVETEAPAEVQQDEETSEAEAPLRPSIFSALRRPSNEDGEAAA